MKRLDKIFQNPAPSETNDLGVQTENLSPTNTGVYIPPIELIPPTKQIFADQTSLFQEVYQDNRAIPYDSQEAIRQEDETLRDFGL